MRTTYRGKLPDDDKRGYVRPEVGGHRFTVGNVRTDSQGEMKRRRDAVADLFELQCRHTGEGRWVEPFLGFAKKLASGQRLKLSVSDYARANVGQASEEAQALATFREMGLDIVPDDPLKRQDNGKPSPSVQNYLDTAGRLKKSMDDRPMWEIDRTKLDEMFAYWRNRPVSSKTGKPIAPDTAKHLMDTLWSILTWIDEEDGWKWSIPNGAKRIRRSPEQIDSDRKKLKSRRITANTYSPEQLAIIASKLDRFGKMILGISVNCAMQPAEVGRLEVDDLYSEHPETNQAGDWIVFNRPKTHEYGEWLLWPEVAELARWGQRRAIQLGCSRIVISDDGVPWYREEWKNPETKFSKWWQQVPSNTSRGMGIVTRLNNENPEFPRLTIKYLRKILPNMVRPTHGKEIADLINARKIDRSEGERRKGPGNGEKGARQSLEDGCGDVLVKLRELGAAPSS